MLANYDTHYYMLTGDGGNSPVTTAKAHIANTVTLEGKELYFSSREEGEAFIKYYSSLAPRHSLETIYKSFISKRVNIPHDIYMKKDSINKKLLLLIN